MIENSRARFLSGIGVPEKGNFQIDDFQRQAIEILTAGEDTLVVAPTGSGKTFIAVEAIKAVLRLRGRAIYTTPLKALSNTKFSEFRKIFEPQHRVGLLTGDRKIEGDADVVIATTEIFRNELYYGSERFSLVILDEVHFISDPQRGAVWEESIILAPTSSTLLMLSASISNADEIAAWISEVRNKPCRIVLKKDRPIELRLGFLHPDWGIVPLEERGGDRLSRVVSDYYAGVGLDSRGLRLRGGSFGEERRSRRRFGRRGRR